MALPSPFYIKRMNFHQPALLQNFNRIASTEGIKYAGSKRKLLPHILEIISSVQPHTVFDGFTGTTRVAQLLAKSGYTVITNDIAIWSKQFGIAYLLNKQPRHHYNELIAHLDHLEGIDGWFSEHYGGYANNGSAVQADGLKKPWQLQNTRKLDAIREEIDRLDLDEVERAVALTSLILALNKVDSSIGHYASYLRKWSPRSYKLMKLEVPQLFVNEAENQVFQGDIFDTVEQVKADLAYFDPPYGSNNEKMPPSRVRYAAYYHLWKTVCLNDHPPLFGKAKRRTDSSDTVTLNPFEDFRQNEATGHFIAVEAIDRLIGKVNVEYVLLSYSSGGRATAVDLHNIMEKQGDLIRVVELDYRKNVMADMRWTNKWVKEVRKPHREFLFLIRK